MLPNFRRSPQLFPSKNFYFAVPFLLGIGGWFGPLVVLTWYRADSVSAFMFANRVTVLWSHRTGGQLASVFFSSLEGKVTSCLSNGLFRARARIRALGAQRLPLRPDCLCGSFGLGSRVCSFSSEHCWERAHCPFGGMGDRGPGVPLETAT